MATQSSASHNPCARSSGKRGAFECRRQLPLAAKVARELGVIPTWPNVQTIRLAIESEAVLSHAAPAEVAEMFIAAGREFSELRQYSCPPEWEKRQAFRENVIDRFWFEDSRWRFKFAYIEFRNRLRDREQAAC